MKHRKLIQNKYSTIGAMFAALIITANCSQQPKELSFRKGAPAFALENGGTISTTEYSEYNPVLVKNSDNTLSLIFGSNRPCTNCSGHNLFIANSVGTFSDVLGDLPLFSDPVTVLVGGSPINASDKIYFTATTGAGSFSNIKVYLNTESLSGNIGYFDITPSNPDGTEILNIGNADHETFRVGGVKSDGNQLMAYDPNTGDAYIFGHASSSTPETIDILFGATGAVNVPTAASGVDESWLGLLGGTFGAGSPAGLAGFTDDLALTLSEEGLFMNHASGFYGGNDASDFITFSAQDLFASGGEDIYAVTTHTLGDMWAMAAEFFDFGEFANGGGAGFEVLGSTPFDGQTGIPAGTVNVSIQFSSPIDTSTVSEGNTGNHCLDSFHIKDTGSGTCATPTTFIYSGDDTQVSFTVSGICLEHSINVEVSSMTDINGNPLTENYIATFTADPC